MKWTGTLAVSGLAVGCSLTLSALSVHVANDVASGWQPTAAAAYLDQRERWWMAWPIAARDHGTFCISCHTALPYALARPALSRILRETRPVPEEVKLLDDVTTRVRLSTEVAPYYPWPPTRSRMVLDWFADYLFEIVPLSQPARTRQSRGTEAVINALILASRDARRGVVGDETRQAFQTLWSLQVKTGALAGAWTWLNFRNEPWEAADSPYFGAAMAAIAVGLEPDRYVARPDIQVGLRLLKSYLQRAVQDGHLFDRVMLLWASTRIHGLLDTSGRSAIVAALLDKQRNDGGWSLTALAPWQRLDGTPLTEQSSDGYATGLITLVLQETGLSRERLEVKRGLDWLVQHQDRTSGAWPGYSLNVRREPGSDTGQFMSDAATAYAVLALTK